MLKLLYRVLIGAADDGVEVDPEVAEAVGVVEDEMLLVLGPGVVSRFSMVPVVELTGELDLLVVGPLLWLFMSFLSPDNTSLELKK